MEPDAIGAMPEKAKCSSHNEYIASAPDDVQEIPRRVQALVKAAMPDVRRFISCNMPGCRGFCAFTRFPKFGKDPPRDYNNSILSAIRIHPHVRP